MYIFVQIYCIFIILGTYIEIFLKSILFTMYIYLFFMFFLDKIWQGQQTYYIFRFVYFTVFYYVFSKVHSN